MTNEELEKLSAEMQSNSDYAKYLTAKTKDLEKKFDSLDDRIKSINHELNKVKKLVSYGKTELKEQLRIQEDRSQRNDIRNCMMNLESKKIFILNGHTSSHENKTIARHQMIDRNQEQLLQKH